MMTFNDFVHKYNLNNKATPNTKIQQVLSSLGLNDVGIYLKEAPFFSDIEIVNLHPFRGTHWTLYIHESYFDSYGCAPTQNLSKFIMKRKRHCLYSEYQIQKNDIFLCFSLFIYTLFDKSVRN